MIRLINIDKVANVIIRTYSENLSISNFPLRDSTSLSSFLQGRILKRSESYKDFNSIYC